MSVQKESRTYYTPGDRDGEATVLCFSKVKDFSKGSKTQITAMCTFIWQSKIEYVSLLIGLVLTFTNASWGN